jgi:hypothetical protein
VEVVASVTLLPHFPAEKSPSFLSHRLLGGPQEPAWTQWREENHLPLPRTEIQFSSSAARNLVATQQGKQTKKQYT